MGLSGAPTLLAILLMIGFYFFATPTSSIFARKKLSPEEISSRAILDEGTKSYSCENTRYC
mgnify:CR=1 FL=1